jgi:pimeloyl-ACP methyl ester carboxylesterase
MSTRNDSKRPDPAQSGKDLVLRLGDGRRVAYQDLGDPNGQPVLALHGTPASRLMYAIADDEAARLGLRVIAPDRWAYGGSDPHPEPSLTAWAADTAEIADQLGLTTFSVLGISGGTPYAAATAAVLGNRVTALALVVPVGPIAGTEAASHLSLMHRLAFRWAGPRPAITRQTFKLYRLLLKRSPRRAIAMIGLITSRCDRILLNTPDIADYLGTTFNAGLEPGVEGAVTDLQIFSSRWDVPLHTIAAPTRIWCGLRDHVVPPAGVRELGRAIPPADMIELADQGHFWIARDYPIVLQWLAENR